MIEDQLGRCVASWYPGATGVTGAAKLSGGASQETWTFDIVHADGNVGAILRRAPPGYGASPGRAAGLDAEATLMQLAHDAGLPSPRVMHVLTPEDELGTGFIMQRIEGETIARKILRDEQFAKARPILARQLGRVIAGIHGLPACQAAETARDERDKGNRRPRTRIPQLQLAASGVRTGAALAARARSRSVEGGDAGAWRFPPRQPHHRPRRRARGAGLGARAFRRPDGGPGVDLRQLLAFRRDRQAGRRLWFARGIVRRL